MKKYIKKQPTVKYQEYLLTKQNNKCYWCGIELDSYFLRPDGIVQHILPVWDHYIPFHYTLSCADSQFVASCPICNHYKSGKIILSQEDEDNMKIYLKVRFEQKGWIDLEC